MSSRASSIIIIAVLIFTLASSPLMNSSLTNPMSGSGTISEHLELVWSEEFDGETINESTWNFNVGNGCPHLCFWGNNELQYYKKENAFIENGYLVIEARKETVIDPVTGRIHQYTSARLDTIGKLKVQFGRVEVRAKLPLGKGIWPAVWMLGEEWTLENARAWPSCGEIDIVELIGSEPSTVHGTVHAPFCYGSRGVTSHFSLPRNKTFSEDFYVFAVEWTTEYIAWFVNDQLYHVVTRREMESRGCIWVFDKPFHIVVNVAVGGYWPGPPDDTTVFPARMYIDYIRVYRVKPNPVLSKLDEPDNEVLARVRGFPKGISSEEIVNSDFTAPVDPANLEITNPDDWYFRVSLPYLVDLEKTRVVNGVFEIHAVNRPELGGRVVLGQYVWLYQGRTYAIELKMWSSCNASVALHVKVPVETKQSYIELQLETSLIPRVYRVTYKHELFRSNVVELGLRFYPASSYDCGDYVVFYIDYVRLIPTPDAADHELVIEVIEQPTTTETTTPAQLSEITEKKSQYSPDVLWDTALYAAIAVISALVVALLLAKLRRVAER